MYIHKDDSIKSVIYTLLFVQAWGKRALCVAVNAGYICSEKLCLSISGCSPILSMAHAACMLLLLVAAGLPVEPTVTPSTSGASLPAAMQIRSRVRWFSPIFTFLLAFFFPLDLLTLALESCSFVRSYRTAIWRKYETGDVARAVPSQVSF